MKELHIKLVTSKKSIGESDPQSSASESSPNAIRFKKISTVELTYEKDGDRVAAHRFLLNENSPKNIIDGDHIAPASHSIKTQAP